MGDSYGWVTFDGTPRQPLLGAYAAAPARATQFELMELLVKDDVAGRVVNTIGGEQWDLMYVPFESYEECDNDGKCGNERYNLMGTYDEPKAFKPSAQTIRHLGVAWVDGVTLSAGNPARVTWSIAGQWSLDPAATIDVELQTPNSEGVWTRRATLETGLPTTTTSRDFDLAQYGGGDFRAVVFKTGDRVTGNASGSLHVSGKIVRGPGDLVDYADDLAPPGP